MSEEDNRSSMIMSMEAKLNPTWFAKRATAHTKYCTLSTGQYWDWLSYVDVSSFSVFLYNAPTKLLIG